MLEASFCLLRNLDQEAGQLRMSWAPTAMGGEWVSDYISQAKFNLLTAQLNESLHQIQERIWELQPGLSLHCRSALASIKKAGPRRGTDSPLTLRTSPAHVGRSCLFCVFGIKYSGVCLSPAQICIREIQTLSYKKVLERLYVSMESTAA